MTLRASIMGTGRPGGTVEYRGDLTPPTRSYASVLSGQAIAARLSVPASTNRTGSAVVTRAPRRNGNLFFYAHGAVRQPPALPRPGVAFGGVDSSLFQPDLVQLHDWQKNLSWFEAGYPRNLGLSFRVPQLATQVTGAPGPGRSGARPLFNRVQRVPRSTVIVPTYRTRGTSS